MYLFYSLVCFTGNGVIYVIGRPIDWVVEKLPNQKISVYVYECRVLRCLVLTNVRQTI